MSASEPGSATPRSGPRPDTPDGVTNQREVETQDGAPRESRATAIPERVSRYRIDGVLGRGGMGVVLDAFDPELDRRVAIKLLRPERISNEAPRRLLREAKVMARLSHRNVVAVFDAGIDEGRVFLAMERIDGQTARGWLAQTNRSVDEIVGMFVEAARGLCVAHDAGITHRDFKLDNVLVAQDGRVCVADFGVALNEEVPAAEDSDTRWPQNMALTRTGATVGTPLYMAPEQHAGSRVGPAADQFSFCVAMHRALYGEQPFPGETAGSIARSTVSGNYVPPTDTRGVPPWLAAIVQRGLRFDPKQRFPSMQLLLDALLDDPRARRRTRLRRGALLVAGWVAVSAAWLGGRAAEVPCTGGRESLGSVWNDDVRALVAETAQTVRADAYAHTWSDIHQGQCEAHRNGELSAEGLDASMGCLQQQRAGFEAAVRLMTQEDMRSGPEISEALAQLHPPARCADAFWLAGTAEAAPSVRAAAQPLRDALAQAEVLHHAGQLEEAVAAVEALAPRFAALGDPHASAGFALVRGRLALEREDFEAAQPHLQQAFEAGLALNLPQLSIEAWARVLFVQSRLVEDPASLLERAGELEALIRGAQAPADLRALAQNNLGAIAGMLGRTQDAQARFEAAAAQARTSALVRPAERSSYALNLALVTSDAAERTRRFEEAETFATEAYGRRHPIVHNVEMQRAMHEPHAASARDQLRTLCPQSTVAHRCGHCFYVLGELEETLGDPHAGALALDRSAACTPDPQHPYAQALRSKSLAYAHVIRNNPDAALEQIDLAAEILQPQHELAWVASDLADLAVLRARALQTPGEERTAAASATPLAEALETYRAAEQRGFSAVPPRRRRAVEALLRPPARP